MAKNKPPKKLQKYKSLKSYDFSDLLTRGNNPNPLRSFAILLEKYPTGLLAGGAFAP